MLSPRLSPKPLARRSRAARLCRAKKVDSCSACACPQSPRKAQPRSAALPREDGWLGLCPRLSPKPPARRSRAARLCRAKMGGSGFARAGPQRLRKAQPRSAALPREDGWLGLCPRRAPKPLRKAQPRSAALPREDGWLGLCPRRAPKPPRKAQPRSAALPREDGWLGLCPSRDPKTPPNVVLAGSGAS